MASPKTPNRKFLTLADRVKVIKLAESGYSQRKIALDFGVGKTQIQKTLAEKRKYLDEFESNGNMQFKRVKRTMNFEDVNELCLNWFTEATARMVNVSGPLLKERALKFASDLGLTEFKASNGWLESFLKRNNIVLKTMSVERGAVDTQTVSDWKEKIPSICQGYEPRNIFNMDETGLFFHDSTKATYFKKGEDCVGGKHSKERLTVALCASMTGEKVKPLVIGKSKQPRCFSKVKVEQLPVLYKTNKTAWMTTGLFEEWLHWFDRSMSGRKVLLFVDNAPSHGQVNLRNVTVRYLPKNTTSLCQPMDQGVIQSMKLKYRKKQLQFVMDMMDKDTGRTGPEILKGISVLEAIYWISKAWNEVEESTVVKCFSKAGFTVTETVSECETEVADMDDDDDDVPLHLHVLARQLFDCDVKELIELDKDFSTCDTTSRDWDQSAQDLLVEMRDTEVESDTEDSSVTVEEEVPVCTVHDCFNSLEKLKDYAKFHGDVTMLGMVMDISDHLGKRSMKAKQTTLDQYLVK